MLKERTAARDRIGPVIKTPNGLAMLIAYRVVPRPQTSCATVEFPDGTHADYPFPDVEGVGVMSEIEFRRQRADIRGGPVERPVPLADWLRARGLIVEVEG